ncbi:MAG: glutamine-hydrolyzing carbamoyl-phosphate synthase small subunit [Bacillota bacterium]
MESKFTRKLVLEDGSVYFGYNFGAKRDSLTELVFNTSMVGYQEILSDPSYTDQTVVMTYPIIGNYGICDEDYETQYPTLGGFVVKEYTPQPSNYRATKPLAEVLEEYNIPAMYGVDTRKLTRHIRDKGSMKAYMTDFETPMETCLEILRTKSLPGDEVSRVSSKKKWFARTAHAKLEVVAIDCGIKLNIVRSLNKRGCNVTVVPYNVTKEEILALKPDGIFLSNGPGNPESVEATTEVVKSLIGEKPIFGICLGHQLISLAYGAKTYKLKFGHRGGNHPVKSLATGKLEITSQNHSYAVCDDSIKNTRLKVTHINVLDNTIEGVSCMEDKVFSVQYHPESAPGPEDSGYLFDEFVKMMEEDKNA